MNHERSAKSGVACLLLLSLAALVTAQAAAAAGSWSNFGLAVAPGNAPGVVEAADALLMSNTGKTFPGRLLLLAQVADGADPSTHSFVPIYRSAAARESYVEKLQADPAWAEFQGKLGKLGQGTLTASYQVMRSWGDITDTDDVWMLYVFSVSNPAAFLAANESFMGSATGKTFPGQLHLSSVVAAGVGAPATHVLSVGYDSEAEMETWGNRIAANPEWQTYLAALNASSEYLGANMSRTVKAWGTTTLKKLVSP